LREPTRSLALPRSSWNEVVRRLERTRPGPGTENIVSWTIARTELDIHFDSGATFGDFWRWRREPLRKQAREREPQASKG